MTKTASAERLYTPRILALAVELADYPLDPDLSLAGFARSRSCGSALDIVMSLDGSGRVDRLGLQVSACAIGQASAAVFARGARGRNGSDIAGAHGELVAWLSGGERPGWPGIEVLRDGRAFPARHEAILLPWRAAVDALSKEPAAR